MRHAPPLPAPLSKTDCRGKKNNEAPVGVRLFEGDEAGDLLHVSEARDVHDSTTLLMKAENLIAGVRPRHEVAERRHSPGGGVTLSLWHFNIFNV